MGLRPRLVAKIACACCSRPSQHFRATVSPVQTGCAVCNTTARITHTEGAGGWMGADPNLTEVQDNRSLDTEHSGGDAGITRRDFLTQLGAAGVVVTSVPLAVAAEPAPA